MESSDALVVGAGIGGLAAAVALQRAGWKVRVLERASSPRELGFALLLAPNATYALRQLGIADAVIAGGHTAENGEMRRTNGELLRRIELAQVRALLPEPTLTVLRPVLHGALMDAAGDAALMLGSEVVGLTLHDGGVEARLADGSGLHARTLIGADGIRSVVRRQLHPSEPPMRPSGLFGLRGVAHDVAHLMDATSGAQYFGRGIEGGLARAGGTTVYWYLSLPRRVVADGSMDPVLVLDRALVGFDRRFRTIALATRPEDMRLDELFDREPLASWGRGAATLLGDAAHPMLPHAGQGAAQALEDAVALGRLLRRDRGPEAALREYERVRGARTSAVVKLARRNAKLGSLEHPIACLLRDTMMRLVPHQIILKQLVSIGRPPD